MNGAESLKLTAWRLSEAVGIERMDCGRMASFGAAA